MRQLPFAQTGKGAQPRRLAGAPAGLGEGVLENVAHHRPAYAAPYVATTLYGEVGGVYAEGNRLRRGERQL